MAHPFPLTPSVAGLDAHAIAGALEAAGACAVAGFPSPALSSALRADMSRLHAAGELRAAAIGHGGDRQHRDDVRGDRTLWLDDPRCGPAAGEYLAALDDLRVALNRLLFLGLREVEAHYALYPPGARYARHRDRFRDSDARVLTVVSYLNPDWLEADGGALLLHAPDGGSCAMLPRDASTACFLSETEHEVQPARRERLSIAAWLRR